MPVKEHDFLLNFIRNPIVLRYPKLRGALILAELVQYRRE